MALGAQYHLSTFIGVNVFVIDAGDEAPDILLTNNDLRYTPTVFPVSNTDRKSQPDVLAPTNPSPAADL